VTHCGIVIVGGGVAGHAVVDAVRQRDVDVALTLVCSQPRLPYDRARLPELLVSGGPAGALELRPAAWYAERGVRVLLGMRAAALQPAARRLRLDDGESLAYREAVLCTGAASRRPRLPGPALVGMYALRDPDDCAAIRATIAAGARRAVVVGGGRRGLAAARGIAALGCAVAVVDPPGRVRALHGSADEIEAVVLDDGEHLVAELVVVAGTTSPQTALASSAGLAVDRGVVVDERMRTSAAGVLAVGGCARCSGVVRTGLVAIRSQAARAADAMLGRPPAAPAERAATPAAAAAVVAMLPASAAKAPDAAAAAPVAALA